MAENTQDRAAVRKTRALIMVVIAGNVAGNTLLSRGLHNADSRLSPSLMHYVYALANPYVIAGVFVLVGWMIANLSLLSRADLSYVLPMTSVSYVLIAFIGHFVLGEHISWQRWIGILTITAGVTLVGETAPLTVAVHPAEDDE